MAIFTEPRAWLVELEDGEHLIEIEGWIVGITGFGLARGAAGRIRVDGRPVPYEMVGPSGYVFAYLEREWHFMLLGHACVIKQGVAGVPIWDLWVDGRRIPHAPMSQGRIVQTAGQILLSLAFAVAFVGVAILFVVRVLAVVGPPVR